MCEFEVYDASKFGQNLARFYLLVYVVHATHTYQKSDISGMEIGHFHHCCFIKDYDNYLPSSWFLVWELATFVTVALSRIMIIISLAPGFLDIRGFEVAKVIPLHHA